MAEHVVNIRERIEKMRTQINDKVESGSNLDNKPVSSEIDNKNKAASNANVISKPKVFTESSLNNPIHGKSDIKSSNIPQKKDLPPKEQVEKKVDEKISKLNVQKAEEDHFEKNSFQKQENNFEQKNFNKEKASRKTFKDYQLKNTFDEQNNKSLKIDDKHAFPQFSLNVNNPISWKLMLLIMLMQLLTNIMLVVVLYIK